MRGALASRISLTLSGVLALPVCVHAAPAGGGDEVTHVREIAELDQATLDRAEALFFSGLAHYRAERFEKAAVDFQQAFVLTRHRDLLFNVARSRERLGDTTGAVEWYRAYLGTVPADETAIIHRIRQLGGEPTAGRPPGEPDPKKGLATASPEGPTTVEEGAGPWPWVALGLGVAAAGAGAWLGLGALDDASAARSEDRRSRAQTLKDDAEQKALTADVLFGVSALAVGTAVFLWWRADAAASSGRVDVGMSGDAVHVGYSAAF